MAKVTIYGLVDNAEPEVKHYVGQTCDKDRRLQEHLYPCSGDNAALKAWVARVLKTWGGLGIVPLEVVDEVYSDAREIYLIAWYRDEGHPLLNVHPGGSWWMKGMRLSPEAKKRIADVVRRRFEDPDQRQRHSITMKRVAADPAVRARQLASWGRYWARRRAEAKPAYEAKMLAIGNRRWPTPACKEKMRTNGNRLWANRDYVAKVRAGQVRAWKNPARRARHSATMTLVWANDPARRERMLSGLVLDNARRRAEAKKHAEAKKARGEVV